MTGFPYDLVGFLKKEFDASSTLQDTYIKQTNQYLEKQDYSRIFDDFSHVMPEKIMEEYITQPFSKFLIALPNENEIKMWFQLIITDACAQLLDDKGKIKEELITLLHWQRSNDKLDAPAIIFAFISALHQQLLSNVKASTFKEAPALLTIFRYVNQQGPHLIIKHLKHQHAIFNNLSPTLCYRTLMEFPKQHPKITWAAAGLSMLSGLMGLGYVLFSARTALKENKTQSTLTKKLN